MKHIINDLLPSKVWIGKKLGQPAHLDLISFTYQVSNENLKTIPKNCTNFNTLSDFNIWVSRMTEYINLILTKYNLIITLNSVANKINTDFNYNYLEEIELKIDTNKYRSTLMTFQNINKQLDELLKVKKQYERFLYNNKLYTENIEDVNLNKLKLDSYKQNKEMYMRKLEKEYHKLDTLKPYDILRLANHSDVPYIAAREYMLIKEEEKKIINDPIKRNSLIRQKRLSAFCK